MPWSLDYEPEVSRWADVRGVGRLSDHEFDDMMTALREAYDQGMRALLSDQTDLDNGFDIVRGYLRNGLRIFPLVRGLPLATVVGERNREAARVWEMVTKATLIRNKVFSDRESAIAWLESVAPPA